MVKMEMIDNLDKIGQLAKRDYQRKLNVQKQKDVKDSEGAENEKIDNFISEFNAAFSTIENLINASHKATNLPEHFDDISKSVSKLQKFVAGSKIFLRTYDVKVCNQRLHDLTTKARELEDSLIPKKKFGFSRKPKVETVIKRDEVDSRKITTNNENFCGFRDRSDETLTLDDVSRKDVTVDRIERCEIKILGAPSTLHVSRLKNCTLVSGPVSTSIFVEDCENCTFVIACQQLRLHSSMDVQIYLHVTSRAIIEDCKRILVAPYGLSYEGLDEHFVRSGLDRTVNNWRSLDDFNWLNIEQPSPNWKVMDECERKSWDLKN